MAQYIDKDALVAEIERLRDGALIRQKNLESIGQETVLNDMLASELNRILSFINTLEVKEVDLEKVFNDEYSKFSNDIDADYAFPIDLADYKDFAKHFFELGLNKIQKGE